MLALSLTFFIKGFKGQKEKTEKKKAQKKQEEINEQKNP